MNEVKKYLITRLCIYFLTLFLAITLVWWMFHLLPGDPILLFYKSLVSSHGQDSGEATAMLARFKVEFGFDKPLFEQYVNFLKELLLHGNLGPSLLAFPASVQTLIWERLPWTIGLLSISTMISWILGIILGGLAGWRQGTKFDKAISVLSMTLSQIPSYIVAVLAVLLFAYFLGWFPTRGAYSPMIAPGLNIEFILSIIQYGTLPALSVVVTSTFAWVMAQRSLLITILGEDYLLFAESEGLTRHKIFFSYAMRNSLLPQITALGMNLGLMVSGSVIIENIFSYPGVGTMFSEAYKALDYNTIMGFLILTMFTVLTANLLIDILIPLVDPRVRLES
jgi:peptide/nickel transport system permease protein